ncbi:MAG: 3-hydroxyacyl-CoA dehydrogenase family protein [Chitinophagaceae bacterium]
MRLAILANEVSRQEWLSRPAGDVTINWARDIDELVALRADAYFDLEFEDHHEHLQKLARLTAPVFINSVIEPLLESELFSPVPEDCQLIRINAWPGFLKRELMEVAVADPFDESTVKEVLGALGWKYWIVPDVQGMITARVIAMIVNEAYYTLQAEVSTKTEIDTAMKLGTNYPAGPFEWSEKIGLKRISNLLTALTALDKRYEPCALLREEASKISEH